MTRVSIEKDGEDYVVQSGTDAWRTPDLGRAELVAGRLLAGFGWNEALNGQITFVATKPCEDFVSATHNPWVFEKHLAKMALGCAERARKVEDLAYWGAAARLLRAALAELKEIRQ